MSLTLEVAGRSDVGRVRPSNEDNFGYDQRLGIFVVCDGMGGHAAGEVASQIAVDTTLVAARFFDGVCSIANVGDSRIYLFREGQLLQLTEDHSLVMEQVRRGMLTLEEAKHSSVQNIITRALGTEEGTLPDLGEFPAQDGDILLLTTDGVLRHVADQEISAILLQLPSLEAACQTLIDAANEGGGEDNATCVLVRVRKGKTVEDPKSES